MDNGFKFLLYKTEQEDMSVNAPIRDETIWLTQKAMAELFGIDQSGISQHLKNIFESGELEEEVAVAKIAIPTKHGALPDKEQLSPTNHYNLDAMILPDKGKISHKAAEQEAFAEYDIFNKTQRIESDFDREVKRLKKSEGML